MNENPAVCLSKTRINLSVMGFGFRRVPDFRNKKANLIPSESPFHNKTVNTEHKYVLLPEIKDIWKNQHNVLHINLLHVN